MEETTPSATSCRASSGLSHWDKLRPLSSGRSQASFTRWIATSGGKKRLPAPPGLVVQPRHPLAVVSLHPFVDKQTGQTHGTTDTRDGLPFRPQKNDPRPLGQPSLDRGRPLQSLQDRPVFRRKFHLKLRVTSLSHLPVRVRTQTGTSNPPKTFIDLFSTSATGKTFHYFLSSYLRKTVLRIACAMLVDMIYCSS
jgi:hypothetical protein